MSEDAGRRVGWTIENGVARVVLDAPGRGNSIDRAFTTQLLAAVAAAEKAEVGVLLLTATGRFWCVGGDLAAFAGEADRTPFLRDLADELHRIVTRLVRLDAVVVAAVQGAAAGAGVSLALAADVVVAARSASFTLAYTKIGLSPDGGSTALLAQSVGLHRALRFALLNPRLSAEEMLAVGALTEVVDDDALEARAEELVATLSAGSRGAQVAAKHLLRGAAATTLETQLELEGRSISGLAMTPDGIEGVDAFLAKRRPAFGPTP